MIDLEWMAWTAPTAGFFGGLAVLLVGMTLWERVSPSGVRRGALRLATTRGDRLFLGLLANAFLQLAWLGLTPWSPWAAAGLGGVLLVWILRSG